MVSLLLRNLFFTVLQPGVVAGLVPYLILRSSGRPIVLIEWAFLHLVGILLIAVGIGIALACILRFATDGKGTLSPLDPTRKLVIKGLYRYSRNPMYVGVMSILIGEALFYSSLWLAVYALVVFTAFHLFIHLHEEPRLRRDFGKEYDTYRENVRRWI